MKGGERLIIVGAAAGLAWFLFTRSRGLTLAGQPANVMVPMPRFNPQSNVQANASTSTALTNVFSQAAAVVSSLVSRLRGQPGNAPVIPSGSRTGITASEVSSWGLQVPANEPAPAVAQRSLMPEPEPFPYWTMPGYLVGGVPFDQPNTLIVPSLPWTLGPDANYIPPPPGSR